MQFKDCCISRTTDGFIIKNSLIARMVAFINGFPTITGIQDLTSGRLWTSLGQPAAAFNIPVLDFTACEVSFEEFVEKGALLSEDCLIMQCSFVSKGVRLRWQNCIYPQLPFVLTRLFLHTESGICVPCCQDQSKDTGEILIPPADTIEGFRLNSRHTRLSCAELLDVSDHCNNYVRESCDIPYFMREQRFDGQFFLFDDYLSGDGIMLVKEAPCPAGRLNKTQEDLQTLSARYAFIIGSGADYSNLPRQEFALYQTAVGVGHPNTLHAEYRRLYRARFAGYRTQGLYMMSNTWGDRNQDKTVCESFILDEIARAIEIGLDVVQIDDGWQTGRTMNSALVSTDLWSGGYYDNNPDFWVPDRTKFPNGLTPITEEIRRHSLKLGLWFSPDLARDYELWEKDAETLISLSNQYDVRFFKLDGLKITNKEIETNLIRMMNLVTDRTVGKVWFNMDITAQIRLGHLYYPQYGSLFIENRYTESCNYYPHLTLKNLWELSKYIPVAKCQFELLNVRRNADLYSQQYGQEDPLRPSLYPMDTVFACTMLSCPLFWMELSHLNQEDVDLLAGIVKVFKAHRSRLASGDVRSIGSLPDGVSHTGFEVDCGDGSGYLLLFREFSPQSAHHYDLACAGKNYTVLYSNGEGIIHKEKDGLTATLNQPASFLFASFELE